MHIFAMFILAKVSDFTDNYHLLSSTSLYIHPAENTQNLQLLFHSFATV